MQNVTEEDMIRMNAMMSLLSDQRQSVIGSHVADRLSKLQSGHKSIVGQEIEIALAFEDEKPWQYVYLKGVLVGISQGVNPIQLEEKSETDTEINTSKSGPNTFMQFALTNLEVFKHDDIELWRDRVKIISKKEAECKEKKANDGAISILQESFSSDIPKYLPNEYISKFQDAARKSLNMIMESFIHKQTSGASINVASLTELYKYFSAVDFTEFNYSELEQLGFLNHENKCMIIPSWAYPIILNNHIGTQIVSITGEMAIVGLDDLDSRTSTGHLKYGFRIESLSK